MPRKRTSRIYSRSRGGLTRYYADFRDFADVGGAREPLVPQGATVATDDADIAQQLAAARLKRLTELRKDLATVGVVRSASIEAFAAEHLDEKRRSGKYSERWVDQSAAHLEVAIEFFRGAGAGTRAAPAEVRTRLAAAQKRHGDVPVSAVGVSEVRALLRYLEGLPGRSGEKLSPGVQRQYLNSLSNLYRRAASEGLVPPGYNPVSALMEKPTAQPAEALWYDVPTAALILESCRGWKPDEDAHAIPYLFEIVATFLLTGGRRAEVFGLEVSDILFTRQRVEVRPNAWRRLKNRGSARSIRLWPQLAEILQAYLDSDRRPKGKLLFPSPRFDTDHLLNNIDRALTSIGEQLEMGTAGVRCKAFRHAYTSARLQTVEPVRTPKGEAWVDVARDTVARELGHGGTSLVARVYGHLPEHRHRSEVVEYHVEQWKRELADRLHLVRPALRLA